MIAFNQKYQRFFTLVARLVIGGVLLVAGGLKAFVPAEAASAVAAYKICQRRSPTFWDMPFHGLR